MGLLIILGNNSTVEEEEDVEDGDEESVMLSPLTQLKADDHNKHDDQSKSMKSIKETFAYFRFN